MTGRGLSEATCTLDDVLMTEALARDLSRPADFRAENAALSELAGQLASGPGEVLQRLTEVAKHVCRADSVGVSVIEGSPSEAVARCVAISGAFSMNIGDTIART